ncbi:hypothetical protein ACIA74_13840 [Streptomyces sp. NPDC051658]|uniref:hypothetical protein n=1 Tax=Streptomyces sp. NPDC051658 TaxID=3365667 RepID=UPI00378B6E08
MDYAERAAELAERAAKTSDPAMAAAAQAFATLALAEAADEQSEHLRVIAGWMDTMTGTLGTTVQNLAEQVEGIRCKA